MTDFQETLHEFGHHVHIVGVGDKWCVAIDADGQSFVINDDIDDFGYAVQCRDMLCVAISKIVETSKNS